MKRFIAATVLTGIIVAIAATLSLGDPAQALNIFDGVNAARGQGQPTTLFGGDSSIFTTIVNILLFVIGALSVIMLIIGGLRYTISGGNSSAVTAAKNTILYAIVGLAIAFFAFAIVNWVLNAIAPGSGGGGAGFTNV